MREILKEFLLKVNLVIAVVSFSWRKLIVKATFFLFGAFQIDSRTQSFI